MSAGSRLLQILESIKESFEDTHEKDNEILQLISSNLLACIEEIENNEEEHQKIAALEHFLQAFERPEGNLLKEAQVRHKALGNVAKQLFDKLDKENQKFEWTQESPTAEGLSEDDVEKNQALVQCIAKYLLRNGKFESLGKLIKEARLDPDKFNIFHESASGSEREKFAKLSSIVESLKGLDFLPLERWISEQDWKSLLQNNHSLEINKSELMFSFGKTRFLSFVADGKLTEAISFARENLTEFNSEPSRVSEIRSLMGNIVIQDPSSVQHSADLENSSQQLKSIFVQTYCYINDIAVKSQLEVVLDGALTSLPALDRSFRILGKRKNKKDAISDEVKASHRREREYPRDTTLSDEDDSSSVLTDSTEEQSDVDELCEDKQEIKQKELSVDTFVKSSFDWKQLNFLPQLSKATSFRKYHSVFVCPITREESTAANPPMMLSCGHVIAKESVLKARSANGLIKCPTCPSEQEPSDVLELHF